MSADAWYVAPQMAYAGVPLTATLQCKEGEGVLTLGDPKIKKPMAKKSGAVHVAQTGAWLAGATLRLWARFPAAGAPWPQAP